MKKLLYVVFLLMAILQAGCGMGRRSADHELRFLGAYRFPEPAPLRRFADLQGNGEDLLVITNKYAENYNYLLVSDQLGSAISQLNIDTRIRSLAMLKDPVEREPWLFVSHNSPDSTYLYARKYIWKPNLDVEHRYFDPIARTDGYLGNPKYDWAGHIVPEFIEDIDGDGSLELVARGVDGFMANPRGLIVYDYASGKLKWQLQLGANLTSILWNDFDGDGAREFICGSIVQRNTRTILNGVDDYNGWLLIVSPQGQVLYREQVFNGLGQLQLVSDDTNRDGRPEILSVTTTWGNSLEPNTVSISDWNGKILERKKTWTLKGRFSPNNIETLYQSLDQDGNKRFLLVTRNHGLVVLDEQLQKLDCPFQDFVHLVWDVRDIDQDGNQEILLQTTDNRFVILDHNLVRRAELASPFPQDNQVYASIVRAGSGQDCRIAVHTETEVRYYSYLSIPLNFRLLNFLKNYNLGLLIGLGLLLLIAALNHFHRENVFKLAANSLDHGLIIMLNANRIRIYNNHVLQLLSDDAGNPPQVKMRSLRGHFPELHELLHRFKLGQADEFVTTMKLGLQQLPHKVTLTKLHGLTRRYLIILQSETIEAASLKDKLTWAETAKRLAHNVRRYIQNALMALQPLLNKEAVDSERKNLEIVREALDHITEFTRAFQRFTELKDLDLRLQDIIPSVEHCLSRCVIPENIQVIRDWGLDSVETLIEPIRFEEALQNVLNNSLDAMPDGGVLQVSVRRVPLHEGQRGGQTVLVEVADSGCGIPSKYGDEIWQLYFTTKDSGTGIGLPESRKIIESMGGTIVVQSEEGKGTVVSIWLKGGLNG